jgi:membrane-associated phospholipid phosphatase
LLIFYFFSILSRVYLGLHKIKDILFGFLVGIFSILIYNFFLLKYFSFLYNRLLFHFMK